MFFTSTARSLLWILRINILPKSELCQLILGASSSKLFSACSQLLTEPCINYLLCQLKKYLLFLSSLRESELLSLLIRHFLRMSTSYNILLLDSFAPLMLVCVFLIFKAPDTLCITYSPKSKYSVAKRFMNPLLTDLRKSW